MSRNAAYNPPAEPTPANLTRPWIRYLLATRPAFLAASFVPCLIGFATAYAGGYAVDVCSASLTLIGALLAHAGINVLNDYYDDRNGTDAMNEDRLFPFTGGSRFIQNGVLSARQTLRYGVALLAAAAALGIWLALIAGPALWLIGALGLFVGWAYSAPPFSLNGRGLGEISVALGFGILIPLGADYVQRGSLSLVPILVGIPYALLVTGLLYINQFPDLRADRAAGKHHWVVRLGAHRARWAYVALAVIAYGVLTAEVGFGVLPRAALIALAPAAFSAAAARQLLAHAERPALLVYAIRMTILAMIGHGLLLAAALSVSTALA